MKGVSSKNKRKLPKKELTVTKEQDGRWKVLFSDQFRKSFGKFKSVRTKKSALNFLLKLSSGWRPKKRNADSVCETSSSQMLKQFKVEGLYVVCTIDIAKEESSYIQVLKVCDILPLEEIPDLVKHLDSIFAMYTDDFINRCKEKCLEGDLEIPKSWVTSYDIVQFKDFNNNEFGSGTSAASVDGRSYVEHSKLSESLLLRKFYPLSSAGVVSHLLSECNDGELDLPFQVTDQELEIIQFRKSAFVVGRSGTGKTTVLTIKLFQKEQQHHMSTEGFYAVEDSAIKGPSQIKEFNECFVEAKGTVLRQLFVTVSPKLCYAVKQQITQLKSFASGGNFSAENSSIDMDDMEEFKDIPDSFVDIPPNKYPLVVTFHKFLMMLDGTVGNSYFERFHDLRVLSHCKTGTSRSVAFQTFIRTKEVNRDRFCSFYWPHFNTQLTKKLDPAVVFTEIIYHIKGGLQAREAPDGKLSREKYVLLSVGRVSTLSEQEREVIYDIFQDYEKMKMEKGEFDIDDLVIDLYHRLRKKRFEGDEMDFVYIDDVQDLTMRQIALFKYVCRNVDEGFVFSGDTAQTIARGINLRFQDILLLFYYEFILKSRSVGSAGKKEKGPILPIFNLTQNFCTHAGVLKLAQSVIELLYRFFPQSIDVLKPVTSLTYSEGPILLEPGNDENAIVTIFGNSKNVGGNTIGFGAEQVILVRDDHARKEISKFVGKQALVLTIVECKDLEFQDVLLYNFFESSPLKNQWRVIYEFMKEQDMLDATSPKSFPEFSQIRHSVFYFELSQLYLAITRSRQRLWIYENIDELSKPMFDYWKKSCLVQVKQLDDSLAQAMQVASSPEEWKSRGVKLFWENNYQMATMCFERAGDTMWEKRAKAAGLKADADRLCSSNLEMASTVLREAAGIFDSIGRAESAAECFCDLEEYERGASIKGEEDHSAGDAEVTASSELVIPEPYIVQARQEETQIAGCKGGEEVLEGLARKKEDVSSGEAGVLEANAGVTKEPVKELSPAVVLAMHDVRTSEPNIAMSSQEIGVETPRTPLFKESEEFALAGDVKINEGLLTESWNGIIIASDLASFLKVASSCHPETFKRLSGHHALFRRFVFECIGRVLQIFHGLANGNYEETLLSEAKDLVEHLKGVGASVGWLDERLSIAEKTLTRASLRGKIAVVKEEIAKYEARLNESRAECATLQGYYDELECDVSMLTYYL